MTRPLWPSLVALWVGATLVISTTRWGARRPLDERLRPYLPGGWGRTNRRGILSVESFREVVGPLSTSLGRAVSRLFGIQEDLERRLARVHSPHDPTTLRVRQLVWAAVVFMLAAALGPALGLPHVIALLLVLGGPLLVFLLIEQSVTAASTRWQERLFLELPVISEQVGMLLGAGYSLGGAIDRISHRGNGVCAQDLARVNRRIRQGLTEVQALREWSELAAVPSLDRLVGILALNRDAGDLGHLISDEARAMRKEVQRQLAAKIDRRAQQVWIPVTVATLVPGTLFIAVPFLDAMRLFGAS